MNSTKQLRSFYRQRRRALSLQQQQQAGINLMQNIRTRTDFRRARHIAIYLPNDGEICTKSLIKLCHKLGKNLYLPVLQPVLHNQLWFLPYSANTKMHKNRYGIEEPLCNPTKRRKAWSLDIVFFPLVAFDNNANRIGMGGGYYDRTFEFKRKRKASFRPKLIGLAHEIQRAKTLPVNEWDIPLDAIITDIKP